MFIFISRFAAHLRLGKNYSALICGYRRSCDELPEERRDLQISATDETGQFGAGQSTGIGNSGAADDEKGWVTAMSLDDKSISEVVRQTLDHYHRRAEAFWEGTRDHDVTQNIEALLRHIQAAPPLTLLDFGCGPGRDLKTFVARGHRAIGLEGAPALADMARSYSNCEVLLQDFIALELPDRRFDGVFANASLFHVPKQELPRVLRQLHAALKPAGILFSSNPRGSNEERIQGDRYGVYYDLTTWRGVVSAAGFVELEHYYRPAGLPCEEQPWLATVWRKV